MFNLLKRIFIKAVCSPLLGFLLLKIYNDRIPVSILGKSFSIFIDKQHVSLENVSRLFLGFYERHELKILKKYFSKNGNDVIEVGGSLGFISLHALALRPDCNMICVEANPSIAKLLAATINLHFPKRCVVKNFAVDYESEKVEFSVSSDSLSSYVSSGQLSRNSVQKVSVASIRLSELMDKSCRYDLICDIEGAEIAIFKNDACAFSMIDNIFIELHETTYNSVNYSISSAREMLTDLGFVVVEQSARAFLFSRK